MRAKSALLLLLCFFVLSAAAFGEQNLPPKPTLTTYFERTSIHESDSVKVQISITNDSDHDLTFAKLNILTPAFIKWYCGGCSEHSPAQTVFELGTIGRHDVVVRELWLKSDPNIAVGQFNLLFQLQAVVKSDPAERILASAQNTLTVSFLGTDTLAGIPLALSGFIIPGLCFWLVLAAFRVPWGIGLALGDKLIYAVLVSVLFLVIGTRYTEWDLSNGLGIEKLFFWAVMGAVTALPIGLIDLLLRLRHRRKEEEMTIGLYDDAETSFRKLLSRHIHQEKPLATVTLTNGEIYYGSLLHQDNKRTSLVGWYKITATNRKMAASQKQLRTYIIKNRAKLSESDAIKMLTAHGTATTGKMLMRWKNSEVQNTEIEQHGWSEEPISLEN